MKLLFEETAISPKLEVCGKKEVDIRNQRPRLRRNRLILVEKAGGGGFFLGVPFFLVTTKVKLGCYIVYRHYSRNWQHYFPLFLFNV